MNKSEILVIDDEPQIRKLLEIILQSDGYKVIQAENGKEGVLLAANRSPDLIVLDIGLPDRNGQEVLKELRTWYQKAILILSVQDNESDIIRALDSGATDYLIKPFRTGELLARIRSAIRKNGGPEKNPIIVCGDLTIDIPSRTVRKNDQILKLTSTEFKLIALFAQNEARVLTHQYILKEVWGLGYQNETQYLRVFVRSLRKKIETNQNQPKHIITESGVGYRFH